MKVQAMTLAFPNPSRSYDETRKAVRFTGHDGMFEVRFFVEVNALASDGGAPNGTWTPEATCLSAFDDARSDIYDVARKAYSKNRRSLVTLTTADFR
jgi:hypothetical protein